MNSSISISVLGPLEVAADGEPVRLPAGRLRTLLVMLAMAGGAPLPVDRLATALWGDDLPEHGRSVVQTYLGRLRRVLGDGLIATELAGYRLRIDPEQVDALRFTRLLETAARAPDPASERAALAEALTLWRGSPFHGVPSDWLAYSEAPPLVDRYLAAFERYADLDLADGRHSGLVARLRELTGQYPLRESLWVRLLVALDRSGRPAEALAQYETIRRRLAEELGTDPSPELRRIHADLLADGPADPAPSVGTAVIPRQLPPDVNGFTGREAALKALHTFAGESEGHGRALVISAVSGTAGVGKTALAVHWAHRVADRFPDGQLYVNLRGYHPSGIAMAPAEAIRGFLTTLGVPGDQVPSDLDTQIGLYRSLLTGKRMLILLDNARDAEQVRPLLPGSPTCLVLVTSRNQLTGLIAAQAAHPLVLDLLPVDEARRLLSHRLGADRIAAEPGAVDEIIDRCAQLPLALAIAAALAAIRPTFPLTTLAAQLRDQRSRLDALASSDPHTDARAVFSWSYQALDPAAARLFRLLGLAPGPDITAPAAASLAALPPPHTRSLLASLCRAHLLAEPTPGRYTFHDLLRAYAAELTHHYDDDTQRHTAVQRLLDHYLHTGNAAVRTLDFHREPIALAPPQPGVVPEDLADYEHAIAWYDAEHSVLIALIRHAETTQSDTYTWRLAWTVDDFLFLRCHWHDQVACQRAAVDALHRLGNRVDEGHARRRLARAYIQLGQYHSAQAQLERALALHREAGDIGGQARALRHLSWVLQRQKRYAASIEPSLRALDLFRALGERAGEADALNSVGWTLIELGEHRAAHDYCLQSLELHREIGFEHGQAGALDSLGNVHHHLGEHRQAAAYYLQALDIAASLGNRYDTTVALTHLGEAQLADGDADAARTSWLKALEILEELGHLDAEGVRAKLDALPSPGAGRRTGRE